MPSERIVKEPKLTKVPYFGMAGRVMLCLLCILTGLLQSQPAYPTDPATWIKRARNEGDPIKRIQVLDEALADTSMKPELRASLFLERAKVHKAMNDCVKAIEDLNLYLAFSPNTLPALLEKIHCLILLDQAEEASNLLEFVLISRPGTARAYVLKGMLYEKTGVPARAEGEYTRALDYDPEEWEALEHRARILLEEGRAGEALQDVNALTRLRPEDPGVFRMRARIHLRFKEYAAALSDYRRVEALRPDDRTVLKEKVLVFFKMGNPAKALEVLAPFDSKGAEDPEALVLKAQAYIQLKDYPQAGRMLKSALAKNPGYAPTYLYTGFVLARGGDVDAALENLNRAIELDSKIVEAYKERARIFIELDEPVRAALDLTAAEDLDHSDGEVLAWRGLTSVKRMLYDAAVNDFTRALELLPGDPRILYDRAVAYYHREDYILALGDLDALIAVRPEAGRALGLRGVVHSSLGNGAQAKEDLDKAVLLVQDDATLWNNRGFLLYKSGDFAAALESLNRAIRLKPDYAAAKYNVSLVVERQNSPRIAGPEVAPAHVPRPAGDSVLYGDP